MTKIQFAKLKFLSFSFEDIKVTMNTSASANRKSPSQHRIFATHYLHGQLRSLFLNEISRLSLTLNPDYNTQKTDKR